MQQARLLLLDSPSVVSQGPATEFSIKTQEEGHAVWVRVYNPNLDAFQKEIAIYYYFISP